MSSALDYSYTFKYILVGDSSVGKSCLLLQFTDSNFQSSSEATIGVEFGYRIIQIVPDPPNITPVNLKVHVWDTAGQEAFKSITRSYYSGAACVILVFDMCNRDSFQNIKNWLRDVQNLTNNPHVQLVLAGNKKDLLHRRTVGFEEAQKYAQEHNMLYLETSAKTGENVTRLFIESAKQVYERLLNSYNPRQPLPSGIKCNVESNSTKALNLSHHESGSNNNNDSSLCCNIL